MLSDKWLRRQYVGYNREYFHDTLPASLPVAYGVLDEAIAGITYFDQDGATSIVIQKSLRKLSNYAKMILLHEMCHVSVGHGERYLHGPLWKKERKRLVDAGAFTPLL